MDTNVAIENRAPSRKPLRLWPGVIAAVMAVVGLVVVPIALPDQFAIGLFGSIAAGALVAVWWLLFSGAPGVERLGAVAVMIVAMLATSRIVHPSIANAGMSMMLPIFSGPVLGIALVAWAVASRGLSNPLRWSTMVVSIL